MQNRIDPEKARRALTLIINLLSALLSSLSTALSRLFRPRRKQ